MTVDPESIVKNGDADYVLKIFQATLNLIAHVLIGIVVGACILISFSNGLPMSPIMQHVVLCAVGYQLLMAEAILSLSADNGWSAVLRFKDKRRAHTILQVTGSALAIAGTLIVMMEKTSHFTSTHGILGFVALVFTTLSLVNGLTSLYAHEWRKFCPGNISKITHICFGIIAFGAASASLCYGFDAFFFRMWAGNNALTDTLIGFTAALTTIIIINPTITFFKKTSRFAKK
ncbi:uncharacterized protein LOC119833057 [Zerene cesonia]|uniref:uncharacterized protein LOC119833057 n=1 Tax=Zerene cesonia TaxID=33412 RepID=UPI0018E57C6D|nr:uncharacterized protein LOC119833057 [Zerene cesonia]